MKPCFSFCCFRFNDSNFLKIRPFIQQVSSFFIKIIFLFIFATFLFSGKIFALSPSSEDIRDVQDLISIPSPWRWFFYFSLVSITILCLLWSYHYWKQRKPKNIKLPHELALERIEQARILMTPIQVREFSITLSNAIRYYIEDRFKIQAAHQTTEEFLFGLIHNPTSSIIRFSTSLEDFLKHCDLVKFAQWSLSTPEMQSMYESARQFVLETQPEQESFGASTERAKPQKGSKRS